LIEAAVVGEEPMTVEYDLTQKQYYDKFYNAKAEYEIWTLSSKIKSFEWNLRSTKYLFWLSMLVSLSGVVFAFWQFAQASRFDRAQGEHDELAFKSLMANLSFKSRSVASLVLFVSIAYLMIYTAFVYPIRIVPPATGLQAETDNASGGRPGATVTETIVDGSGGTPTSRPPPPQ
jgi:hypothetical protein